VAVLAVLYAMGGRMVDALQEYALRCFQDPFDFVRGDPRPIFFKTFSILVFLALPSALAAVAAATAVGFYQAGYAPNWELIFPKWDKLDPIPRFQQYFNPTHQATEILQNVGKVSIIAFIAYGAIRDAFPVLSHMVGADLVQVLQVTLETLTKVAIRSTLALAVLAFADYGYSWWQTERSLKMTKEEVKDESKQSEGDPAVKMKIRQKGRERLRMALMRQLRTADVVVTNPTHVSVALRYRPKEGAPLVVAKGYDEMAFHIRLIAKRFGVQIVPSPELARTLAKRVRVGRPIPVDLYGAVAEILAFVYRLKGKTPWD
jgi:flagellar biosynthetic protein FlhB